MKKANNNTEREYYQVVTTDRTKYFREHANIESAIEHITELLNGTAPHNTYEYEIIHVVETRKEETINYPVYL
jgi:hypothetical protein